jgi:hypothetical protein
MEVLKMAWKIRKELKKYLSSIKFNVESQGNNWYEVKINHPAKTIEDAKSSLAIRDMVYEKMHDFEIKNNIILTITI